MSDSEEPVCKFPAITEECKPKCQVPFAKYQDCIGRLAKKGEGDCEPWYFDYLKCIDKCRVPQIGKHLK